jgi:1-acyl-sn-glycerol-3-phosphate acyltransferase
MIAARHTWLHVRFFRWYTDFRIRRNFASVTVHGPVPDTAGKPLMVIGNHFSWWDGFFILWLNNRFFHKRFHVMMLEDQLRKNMILNHTGAFSIKPGSRDVIRSLSYARRIIEEKGLGAAPGTGKNVTRRERLRQSPLLLMYPQGAIRSMHARGVRFEPGIRRIIRGLEGKVNILMVVALVDYLSGQNPQLHFYLQGYPSDAPFTAEALESAFNSHLTESLNRQSELTK